MKRGRAIFFWVASVGVLLLTGCPRAPELVVFSDPLTAEEHASMGAIYEREGNLEMAVREYAASIKKDPHNLVALTGLGNASVSEGKYLIAAGYYRRALEVDPDNFAVLNNLAMCLTLSGKPGKAMEYADKAVEVSNEDPRALDTRAQTLMALGEEERAAADLARAVRICEDLFPGSTAEAGGEITAAPGESLDLDLARDCKEISGRFRRMNIPG